MGRFLILLSEFFLQDAINKLMIETKTQLDDFNISVKRFDGFYMIFQRYKP